ncbi:MULTISPECIES: DUF4783 domain-containing protein [Hymenobacter]|uniref:DUF4783 domain-containing protein n=1 Tax=Hymenobacter jejuensis TaxID=2502781 RepID=A0A5B8A0H4_9BACT|nr:MULTISPECIES: DUF4783 domain-containing protein [Hymenobacter]MBC6991869.1 DUF4783 domain-containing protein [Hymenobacter sp. BT491]QDA60183.1 DUF4783 domain-containing protein [Hymenobacter jejuensis]
MKRNLYRALVITCLALLSIAGYAQGEAFGPVRDAIRTGSSHELAQFFSATVELGFDGDKQSYSPTQAEFVMKDFFAKNAPNGFEYIHQGASNGGIPYAIGKYNGKSGSYRVFVKMKSESGTFKIDNIEFTKE